MTTKLVTLDANANSNDHFCSALLKSTQFLGRDLISTEIHFEQLIITISLLHEKRTHKYIYTYTFKCTSSDTYNYTYSDKYLYA